MSFAWDLSKSEKEKYFINDKEFVLLRNQERGNRRVCEARVLRAYENLSQAAIRAFKNRF